LPPNKEQFPVGTRVRVKSRSFLKQFQRPAWIYHHPLSDDQLEFAGITDTVKGAAFSHGLFFYQLVQTPGVWHEECLECAG
jgi:hypothetical protein